ncbi:hypothetical protein BSZ21_10205 [Bradyrhizobium canariense]|uniref:DUF4268 domain-containing protein n=1 Tax=Bradyrhizobium canariense TaxID=255045 RepID=UPI000A1992F8|nr:DUF4268 domain-containing protein [Bradyrhizobium canariense]OSI70974.1 hypothetical protein BSZ21_10205 [Bradyrhizobium canariense]
MTDQQLGRLQRVDLRDIWISEATSFTPWLAKPENMAILGETLNIDLELEAQERAVGPFRADLLCKDIDTDRWVLIENQLERTDHTHLGQLLTYASGLDAVTIVWIAARFTEEHRSTLDWLNKITNESFRFFGLEVELWRIGTSPAAPKFNIVSKPNEWSHSVAKAARVIDDTDQTDTRLMQARYWAALNAKLDEIGGPISGKRKPQPQSWIHYRIGRSFMGIGGAMNTQKKQIRAELYMTGTPAKSLFGQLREHKTDIERDLGYSLEWQELPDKQDARIAIFLENSDPADETDWPRQISWLAERLIEMHRVFAPLARDLTI